MSEDPVTPRAKQPLNPTTPKARVAGSQIVQSSPHYATTRRHSLYGTEDRVVIDPGSRIWKVGFSGEGRPRDVFLAAETGTSLWELSRARDPIERDEQDRLLEVNLETCFRFVFHRSLLTDPKSRKVILIEHPLLPLYIKEVMARILFNNLQVPSISFASSHLLSLLAVGRITGLVIDCGHLESTALPIFASRPLYPQLRTTPLAGSRLSSHLRALLLLFGSYLPPPSSLGAGTTTPAANRAMRVPEEILTDAVIEEIKTRCCFVSDVLDASTDYRPASPSASETLDMDIPPPSDSTTSDSEFSTASIEPESNTSQIPSESYEASRPADASQPRRENHLEALASMYKRHSTATELQLSVIPPVAQQTGTGRGTLIIPGWIRERAAEVLFEGGDVDESSVAEVILDALLKVPMDLRKTMASSILAVGGTLMLPGFIPRLHAELLRAIAPPTSHSHPSRPAKPSLPHYDQYASLRPLTNFFAILNNPAPPPAASARASANAGKAPAFTPATMAWIGGSLAGSLKTGGAEVARERWDEADPAQDVDDLPLVSASALDRAPRNILPDWTRIPVSHPTIQSSPQAVGA